MRFWMAMPPPKRLDALDVAVSNRLAVIEEPMQAVERNLPVHLLVDVQGPCDRFVVGGMQTKRPAVLHQMPDHRFQFTLHDGRHVGPRLEQILKIRR